MLSELIQKLEREHGINPSQGHGILNTIAQHIKEGFPMAGGMIDNIFGSQTSATSTNPVDPTNPNVSNPEAQESTLEKMEDLAKTKLGGLFGGLKT